MFTEADHAKAVELAQILPQPDWWPDELHATFNGEGEFKRWILYATEVPAFFALSAIAWAMVERLGDVDLYHDPDRGYFEYSVGVVVPTRFLALAAAIEDQK